MRNYVLAFVFVFLLVDPSLAQDDLKVIQPHWVHFTDGSNALYKHFTQQAFDLLEARENEIKDIDTREGWEEWRESVREKLHEVVGPFPEKTPLNPQTTRTVQKEGYKIEHVVFESQPGFFVSSSLFIPDAISGKAPAIIYCSGHHLLAYRNPTYQHVILNLVKKGFIVFAFDPVGQGERLEYFDKDTGNPTIGGPTKQHSYPGAQAFLAGSSLAKHMIWDGIRAVDYLHTRPEVDADRIGITGRSGGGTQSAYIAAFDVRIFASAPENYITTFKRLLYTHGPQDAEQNFFQGIVTGLDQPDLLLVRVPKPNMMITTTRDIFNIQGAREAAAELKRSYQAYQKEDNFLMVEDDAAHASTLKNREAMYAFFQKHLDLPGNSRDEIVDSLSTEELQVTATGQVLSTYGGVRVFDLNQKELEKKKTSVVKPANLVKAAAEISGYRIPVSPAETMMVGRIQREGYVVEKHLMKGEGDYWVPYILMKPEAPTEKAVIYLDPDGKGGDAGVGGEMERIVKNGSMVLAPDLLNTGEMGEGNFTGDSNFEGNSYNLWFGGILIGRSVVATHAGDVNRLANVLKDTEGAKRIFGFGKQRMSAVMLHAASFNPEIEGIALETPTPSFQSIVEMEEYDPSWIEYTVAGALPVYDLPDLLDHLAKDRKVLILDTQPRSHRMGEVYPEIPEKVSLATPEEREHALKEWLE